MGKIKGKVDSLSGEAMAWKQAVSIELDDVFSGDLGRDNGWDRVRFGLFEGFIVFGWDFECEILIIFRVLRGYLRGIRS
ncbi:unnamed protein product [Anisakis simplex]|uniref:Ribonuclease H protein n=1 Tax=Anisakis simplex TaxID=6269 RepID=A0A0M3JCA0_ANISI|nr:unnamed protein product [Anisakis simplex]